MKKRTGLLRRAPAAGDTAGPAAMPARRSHPTLADVAAQAGVSINTVSRSLRVPQTVRPALRRHIHEVLARINYVPNRLAGGLAGAHTGVVGVVITTLFYSEFAATIDAMQRELAAADLHVMIGNSRYDPEEEFRLVRAMLSWRPAAIAIVGIDHDPRAAALLRDAGVPVVEIWDCSDQGIDSVVGMDHRAIGRLQAGHLIERGCRRLAFVGAVRDHDHRARKRQEGAAQAVRARLGGELPVVTVPSGGTPDIGERLVDELLARAPRVDGVVCNSDVIAFGVLRGLRRRGRLVPDEVAVIGFGDNEAGACLQPALTTVRPPRADIGRVAAATILARIDGEASRRHELAAELVERESTPRAAA